MEGEHDKSNNVFNAKPCHVRKIKLHDWSMARRKESRPYPQGMMIHQKGCELFEESN
jgi:hypothetical protein